MKNRTDFYTYLAVAVIALMILLLSIQFEFLSAKLLPIVVSSVVLALSVIGAIKAAIPDRARLAKTVAERDQEDEEFTWKEYSRPMGWLAGYFVGIFLVGFLIATPLFIAGYMKTHGSRWRQSIIVTVITMAVVYLVFIVIFKVSLYSGLLPS
jgi:magnesium-transporting ATPase (P-type)